MNSHNSTDPICTDMHIRKVECPSTSITKSDLFFSIFFKSSEPKNKDDLLNKNIKP